MHSTRRELNKKLWRIVSIAALVGAIWPPVFYNAWFLKGGAELERSLLGLMLVLCPPYIASMAFDHMQSADRIETIWCLSAINAGLYAIFGLAVATAREQIARRRGSI